MFLSDIYLDNNATTKLSTAVRKGLLDLLDEPIGNPSSPHSWGHKSREVVEKARSIVASFLGCLEEEIIFTSCASEANSMVLRSFSPIFLGRKTRIITSTVEHPSITRNVELLAYEGSEVVFLPVDSNGLVNKDELCQALDENTDLVSIQWVNSETGVVQDIPDLAKTAHQYGALFHTDAVQVLGKLRINLNEIPIDYLSFTGHKLHAPQGLGAVVNRGNHPLRPLVIGGEQERSLRAGTENILGIAALGVAFNEREMHLEQHIALMKSMRDSFERRILGAYEWITVNGSTDKRAVNTSNLKFKGLDGRALTALLDQAGLICSQSSACSSSIPEPSHVLKAMGLTEDDSYASIRFSFSVENSISEAEAAADLVIETARRLRKTTEEYSFH